VELAGVEGALMVLIHKEREGPALDESPVGEVCAIPVDRFPFSCFTCLEEIVDESEVRLSEELGDLSCK
jgi:glycosylphosphatidylinositol transamidase (GPIT) subunit GPI8